MTVQEPRRVRAMANRARSYPATGRRGVLPYAGYHPPLGAQARDILVTDHGDTLKLVDFGRRTHSWQFRLDLISHIVATLPKVTFGALTSRRRFGPQIRRH